VIWVIFRREGIVVRFTKAERRRFFVYPVLLGLGAGLLASCFGQGAPPLQPTSAVHRIPPSPEITARNSVVPRPARKPNAPSSLGASSAASGPDAVATTQPTPATAVPGPENATAPASTAPQTGELIGLDQSAATRLFGAAAERLEEPPATVWRYKNANCELDLFFYLDLRSGQMRTLHYALKNEAADNARGQDCLRSLVTARGS
jgi:hypothetical protein